MSEDFTSNEGSNIPQRWENHYRARTQAYSEKADWWTLRAWRKYLYGPILKTLPGKLVLDVGCGTAIRVATLVPIQEHGYRYIGIDSSTTALTRARTNMPGGSFLCANLDYVCLLEETVDVVLCLGVLMYFQNSIKILNALVNVLKPGGLLLLHDVLPRKSWSTATAGIPSASPDVYPPHFGIRLDETTDYLRQRGVIMQTHLAGSPLRKLIIKTLGESPLDRLRPVATWCDSACCVTVGRIFPALGASEVQLIFQKKG